MLTDTMTQAEREVVDFLLRSPSVREIAEFQLSPKVNARLDGLLHTNREASLTDEERTEVERYVYFEHFMRMLKIAAHQQLSQQAS